MISAPAVLAGAAVGTGLALIAVGWRRPAPDLQAALDRLDGLTPERASRDVRRAVAAGQTLDSDLANPSASLVKRLATRLDAAAATWITDLNDDPATQNLMRALKLGRFTADLALLGDSVERLLARKAGYLLLGLAFPPVLSAALALIGARLPWTLPALAALVLGGVLFMVPDYDVRTCAAKARAELRRAVCTYLELVALERAADAGAIEAVERAAAIGDAPAFTRIRDALVRAQLDGAPPWRGLAELAEATCVPELGDVADIMATSSREGAAVYSSLRARATSLRTAITTQEAAAANAASEHMIIPVSLLGIVFMALVGYPAFARILGP